MNVSELSEEVLLIMSLFKIAAFFIMLSVPFPIFLYETNTDASSDWKTSDYLSLVSLVIAAFAACFSVYQFNKSRNLSIKEAFWLREVIFPSFVKEFMLFFETSISAYNQYDSPEKFYIDKILPDINKLQDLSSILDVGCSGLRIEVCEALENFHNKMMDISSKQELVDEIIIMCTGIVCIMQKRQLNMK